MVRIGGAHYRIVFNWHQRIAKSFKFQVSSSRLTWNLELETWNNFRHSTLNFKLKI